MQNDDEVVNHQDNNSAEFEDEDEEQEDGEQL